ARLSLFRRAQSDGHRVDARNCVKIVRAWSEGLYAWHKNAGATDRICGGSQGAYGFSETRDFEISKPSHGHAGQRMPPGRGSTCLSRNRAIARPEDPSNPDAP